MAKQAELEDSTQEAEARAAPAEVETDDAPALEGDDTLIIDGVEVKPHTFLSAGALNAFEPPMMNASPNAIGVGATRAPAPELSQDYIRMAEEPLEVKQMREAAEAHYQRDLNVQRQEQQA